MNTAFSLVEKDPDFFKSKVTISEYWHKVQIQAARHMRRLEKNDLFDINRPNESDEVKDYRDSVRRDITSEGTWTWINKVSRIFIEHGIAVEESSLSEAMKEWVNGKPFEIAGREVDMNTFMYELILPFMIEDPNAVLLPLPVVPDQPTVNPIGEESPLSGNDRVGVMNLLISSSRIVFLNNYVFAWNAGDWVLPSGAKKDYFFIVDRQSYYRYIPVESGDVIRNKRSGKKVEYQLEEWYPHNTDQLLVNQLGGNISRPGDVDFYLQAQDDLHGSSFYYESYLRPFFELADEVTTSFSDNQGVRVQHNSPKLVMDRIPCLNKQCSGGYIIDKKNRTRTECPDCVGGYIQTPGPYNVIIRKDNDGIDNPSNQPTLEYVAPPVANLQNSYDTVWDLMRRAKRSIGLDLLEDLSESGVAKSRRLEDLNDILRKVSGGFFGIISRHLMFVEMLLEPSEQARKKPRVKMPTDLQYKPQDVLKDEAQNALPSDRYQSALDYYGKKYVNAPAIIKAHRLSITWAPILLATPEEISSGFNWGFYDSLDLAKKDWAYIIFKTMAEKMGDEAFIEAEDPGLIAKADEEIKKYVKETGDLSQRLGITIGENG